MPIAPPELEPFEPLAVVPLPPLVLLVVPDEVPPLVSVGTDPLSVGTEPPRLGTEPLAVGGLLGNEGTEGTEGPVPLLVPAVLVAAGVTTVVAPDGSVGGITVAVAPLNPRPAFCGALPPVMLDWVLWPGEVVEVPEPIVCVAVAPPPPPPTTRRGAAPSGKTHTTSRFEQ